MYISIYVCLEIDYGNKFNSMKKIEKRSIPNVMNLLKIFIVVQVTIFSIINS